MGSRLLRLGREQHLRSPPCDVEPGSGTLRTREPSPRPARYPEGTPHRALETSTDAQHPPPQGTELLSQPRGGADPALLVYFPALPGSQHYGELYEPESFSSMEPEVYQFPVVPYIYPKLHPPCLCYLYSAWSRLPLHLCVDSVLKIARDSTGRDPTHLAHC